VTAQDKEGEWIYPLLMHGVPEYHFAVAATAPGYLASAQSLDAVPDGGSIQVELFRAAEGVPTAKLESQKIVNEARDNRYVLAPENGPLAFANAQVEREFNDYAEVVGSGTVSAIEPSFYGDHGFAVLFDRVTLADFVAHKGAIVGPVHFLSKRRMAWLRPNMRVRVYLVHYRDELWPSAVVPSPQRSLDRAPASIVAGTPSYMAPEQIDGGCDRSAH
jgi:hypothetical protein